MNTPWVDEMLQEQDEVINDLEDQVEACHIWLLILFCCVLALALTLATCMTTLPPACAAAVVVPESTSTFVSF